MKSINKPARSSLVLWSLIILMLGLTVFSIFVRRSEPELSEAEEKAYPVRIQQINPTDRADMLLLPARLEPALRARLPSDKPGRIATLLADRGDAVTNGQVLLRLDDRLWRAMLEAARIEHREAERAYQRWADMEEAGAVSASDMDEIRARLDRANVAVIEAETHVSQTEVRSPADGVINNRFVEQGEYATEGMAVFELVVTDPIKVRLDIPERDAPALASQDRISFRVLVLPDQVFTAQVTFTAAAATPANNTFPLEAVAANKDGRLQPGMLAEVTFQRGILTGSLAVPLEAVIPRRGEQFVFVAQDGRAVRRLVRIDRIAGENAILADGVNPGEWVVIQGNRALIDGALLHIVEE